MALLAVFGITNDGLNLVVNLLLLFLVVLWIALVYWTYADARRRIEDPMLIGCAVVASLFPFVGTVVYTVVRPPEYLEDVHERELEIAAAETRLAAAQEESCPYCQHPIERSFLRCPSCTRKLKEPCGSCAKPLDPRWRLCPYCEAEVAEPPPPPRQQRRRERERTPSGSAAPAKSEPSAAPASAPAPSGSKRAQEKAKAAKSEAASQRSRGESPPAEESNARSSQAKRPRRTAPADGGEPAGPSGSRRA